MNRKGMQNIFVKRLSGLLCAWLFPFAALYAQVDTTTYHQLSGVEVLGKVRPSTTRESTPLQMMDKAGIERLGVQDLSEAVKRFSGVTVQDYGGIGGLKTVSVRSLGAKHTAVCYDGVTVTDAQSGQVDISRFSLCKYTLRCNCEWHILKSITFCTCSLCNFHKLLICYITCSKFFKCDRKSHFYTPHNNFFQFFM